MAYTGTGQDFRSHEARVDTHPVAHGIGGGPVRDAAAIPATAWRWTIYASACCCITARIQGL